MFKKILFSTIFLFFLLSNISFAAGSASGVLTTFTNKNSGEYRITWVGDSGTGAFTTWSIPADVLAIIKGSRIQSVVTNPGATAPTDNYDIELLGPDGEDICGNKLWNRDLSTTEEATCLVGGTYLFPLITTSLQLKISNNTDVSATGDVVIKYVY